MEWSLIVSLVAGPLAVYWGGQGIYGLVKARQARRAELASDEAAAAREERTDDRTRARWAERRVRILDDYAHTLRAHIARHDPPPPPPWPVYMTSSDDGEMDR